MPTDQIPQARDCRSDRRADWSQPIRDGTRGMALDCRVKK